MDIHYDRCNVANRLETEIVSAKGESFWSQLTQEITVPSDEMDWQQCSACMRVLMHKFQLLLPAEEIKSIMVNVRHDLRRDDFDWAVRLFHQIGNIDQFAIALQKIGLGAVISSGSEPSDKDRETIDFVQRTENIFYGRRYRAEILAQAIPADVGGYLRATDDRQRRYALCHCQFARESILQDEGPVSPLICECSLGHTMMLWETVLERKLEGEVLESALNGSNRCLFKIRLPADVIERWT
ncbi:MAG TPA: hypothetical protein VFF68_03780 [Anaerolineaceae bacterium]|nr:hypothetical protein [Anaerolineaceae bacterium]